jgi:hypothetical protein
MRKSVVMLLVLLNSLTGSAQSQEVQQLLLNVEKLSQFKAILQNMYDGYKMLHQGYTAIKEISEGSFSLHKTFLDALLQVSPAVRNYPKVGDIVALQTNMVKDYKAAFRQFSHNANFTPSEIAYLDKVYQNLLKKSLSSLEDLTLVITPQRLRMNDEERLSLIDTIYEEVSSQTSFLRELTSSTWLLSIQRGSEIAEIKLSRKLRGF